MGLFLFQLPNTMAEPLADLPHPFQAAQARGQLLDQAHIAAVNDIREKRKLANELGEYSTC